MKRGAAGRVRRNPQPAPVGLDDRPADRETHSHTARFCGEERVEYPINIFRVDAGSRVSHRYPNVPIALYLGSHRQDPRSLYVSHRVIGVRDQVYKHLL